MITQITTPSMIGRANHICEDSKSDRGCTFENMKPETPTQTAVDRRKKKKRTPSAYFDMYNIPHAPSQCQSCESWDDSWLPSPPSEGYA